MANFLGRWTPATDPSSETWAGDASIVSFLVGGRVCRMDAERAGTECEHSNSLGHPCRLTLMGKFVLQKSKTYLIM